MIVRTGESERQRSFELAHAVAAGGVRQGRGGGGAASADRAQQQAALQLRRPRGQLPRALSTQTARSILWSSCFACDDTLCLVVWLQNPSGNPLQYCEHFFGTFAAGAEGLRSESNQCSDCRKWNHWVTNRLLLQILHGHCATHSSLGTNLLLLNKKERVSAPGMTVDFTLPSMLASISENCKQCARVRNLMHAFQRQPCHAFSSTCASTLFFRMPPPLVVQSPGE